MVFLFMRFLLLTPHFSRLSNELIRPPSILDSYTLECENLSLTIYAPDRTDKKCYRAKTPSTQRKTST